MPVERLLSFQLLAAYATLVDKEVGEVNALDVVADIPPGGLSPLANGADVAAGPVLHPTQGLARCSNQCCGSGCNKGDKMA